MARNVPVREPATLDTATIPPTIHKTLPDGTKDNKEALKVPRLTSFAEADALNMSMGLTQVLFSECIDSHPH